MVDSITDKAVWYGNNVRSEFTVSTRRWVEDHTAAHKHNTRRVLSSALALVLWRKEKLSRRKPYSFHLYTRIALVSLRRCERFVLIRESTTCRELTAHDVPAGQPTI